MPVLRSSVLIDASPRTVAGVLRDADGAATALRPAGHRLNASVRLLTPGDQVGFAVRVLPGIRIPLRARVTAVSIDGMTSVRTAGLPRVLTHTVTLTTTSAGTRVDERLTWTSPFGPLGRLADAVLLRRLVRRALAARADVLFERVTALAVAPVVVATALVRDGRVLAARRIHPPELAGRWELPGGWVEAGETEPDAVVRECREELGSDVLVTGRLGTDLPIAAGALRVHVAELAPGSPEPRALEHSALRWVTPAEMATLAWVEADRAMVADLVALLIRPARPAG